MTEDLQVIIAEDQQQLVPEPPSWASFACDQGVAEWNIKLLAGKLAQVIYDEIGPETAAFLDQALFRTGCLDEVIAALRKRVAKHAEAQALKAAEPTHKPAAPAVMPTVPEPARQLEPGFPDLPQFLDRANPACMLHQPIMQINSRVH